MSVQCCCQPKVEYHQDRGRWEVELDGELPPTELFQIENWLATEPLSFYLSAVALRFRAAEQKA